MGVEVQSCLFPRTPCAGSGQIALVFLDWLLVSRGRQGKGANCQGLCALDAGHDLDWLPHCPR